MANLNHENDKSGKIIKSVASFQNALKSACWSGGESFFVGGLDEEIGARVLCLGCKVFLSSLTVSYFRCYV